MGHRTRSCCFRLIVLCSICLALRVSILENGSLEARPLAGRTVNSGVYGQATVVVSSSTLTVPDYGRFARHPPAIEASSEWSFQARASELSGCAVAHQSGLSQNAWVDRLRCVLSVLGAIIWNSLSPTHSWCR
jgi:hypothetical protein